MKQEDEYEDGLAALWIMFLFVWAALTGAAAGVLGALGWIENIL